MCRFETNQTFYGALGFRNRADVADVGAVAMATTAGDDGAGDGNCAGGVLAWNPITAVARIVSEGRAELQTEQ